MNLPMRITRAYRLIPARIRGMWNPKSTSNSHIALAALQGKTGLAAWRIFLYFALPRMSLKDGIPFWLDGESH